MLKNTGIWLFRRSSQAGLAFPREQKSSCPWVDGHSASLPHHRPVYPILPVYNHLSEPRGNAEVSVGAVLSSVSLELRSIQLILASLFQPRTPFRTCLGASLLLSNKNNKPVSSCLGR